MRVFKTTWTSKKGDKIPTKNWYIEFKDHLLIRRRLTAYTDKGSSEALGRRIMQLVYCKMAGDSPDPQLSCWLEQIPVRLRDKFIELDLIDAKRGGAGNRLAEHLEDFKQSLLAQGNTIGYVNTVVARTQRIIERCGFRFWRDMSASQVEQCLSALRNGEENISAQTFNFYLQAIKQFAKWMVNNERATASPLQHLKGLNVRVDRRHDRRALDVNEVRRLLETTSMAKTRGGMTGHKRALLYRLAIETGLRVKELKSLKVSSFDFDNNTVTVQAAYSKNRWHSELPLRPDTARQLKQYLKTKMPSTPAFNMPYKTANMLKDDLADAGIPYVNNAGLYADFHALRHTTGSLLAAEGVHPKIIQSIMRHSDINLTMSRYTHIFQGQESEAVSKLPDLGASSKERRNAVTGTDDGQ